MCSICLAQQKRMSTVDTYISETARNSDEFFPGQTVQPPKNLFAPSETLPVRSEVPLTCARARPLGTRLETGPAVGAPWTNARPPCLLTHFSVLHIIL